MNLVQGDAALAQEFERVAPPTITVQGRTAYEMGLALSEAQVALRAVEGWLTGVVAAADRAYRLQLEAAKNPPGFS